MKISTYEDCKKLANKRGLNPIFVAELFKIRHEEEENFYRIQGKKELKVFIFQRSTYGSKIWSWAMRTLLSEMPKTQLWRLCDVSPSVLEREMALREILNRARSRTEIRKVYDQAQPGGLVHCEALKRLCS